MDKYQCTNCKKKFKTKSEGMRHFKLTRHSWGGLLNLEGKQKSHQLCKDKQITYEDKEKYNCT